MSDRLLSSVLRPLAARTLAAVRRLERVRSERVLAVALVALLAAALVPMVAISAYDHSYADDWHYSVNVHLALAAGGGAASALSAAVAEVIDAFFTWQGTYSAIFLMALQPGVFSEELYGAGAVGIMATLIAATAYAASVLVRDVLGAGRAVWVSVTAGVLLLETQLMPSPVEGIWWYNSAIYYTFYHALLLVMMGLAVRMLRGGSRRGAYTPGGTAVRAVALAALAAVVAGGNFVTALVAALALAGAWLCAALGPQGATRRHLLIVPALVAFALGFTASVAAPGNAARQATQFAGDGLGVLSTLLRSGFAAGEYLVLWTNGLLVLMLALVLPPLVRAAARSSLSFRLPGAGIVAAFALFAASFTPTFFSMGTVGPGRVQNIRYDLFVTLVVICATWVGGWWVRRREAAAAPPGAHTAPAAAPSSDVSHACAPAPRCALTGALLIVLAFGVGALALDERHADDLVAVSAARSLASGEAAAYDAQIRDRIALIEESDAAEVEVPFITTAPKVLFMGDIRDNMANYINFRLAQWYGKDSIIGYHAAL